MAHPLFDFSQLTTAERAQLAADLWDSIALDAERAEELPVPEEHRAEVLRRLEARRRDPAAGVPWEEARGRILARLDALDAERAAGGREGERER